MDKNKLLEEMSSLGVPMMVPEKFVDVHKTLVDVIKSRDARLWENFPNLLANVLEKHQVDLNKLQEQLNQSVNQEAFKNLLALSKALYELYHVQVDGFDRVFKAVFKNDKKMFQLLRDGLMKNHEVSLEGVDLSVQRLKNSFEDYLSYRHMQQQKQNAKHNEMSMEYALSQVFSPKQKELFNKRLNREKMTKTEREYYYRVVKKKAQALANPELHRLAQNLMEK